jgi:hypothetical protein
MVAGTNGRGYRYLAVMALRPLVSTRRKTPLLLDSPSIGSHEELLLDLLEGLCSLAEHHYQGFKAIMEQISELAHRQPSIS